MGFSGCCSPEEFRIAALFEMTSGSVSVFSFFLVRQSVHVPVRLRWWFGRIHRCPREGGPRIRHGLIDVGHMFSVSPGASWTNFL